MKIIITTGTPGTGKTTLSKKLARKLHFYYIDANKIIAKYKLSEGYDRKRRTKIIDTAKLNKKLIQIIGNIKLMKNFNESAKMPRQAAKKSNKYKPIKGIIIDSHLSHYLPRKYVDWCIVTKCSIRELNKRLKKKRFHKEKIKENLEAEIFDVCCNEAKQMKHKIMIIDTSKHFNINQIAKKLGG